MKRKVYLETHHRQLSGRLTDPRHNPKARLDAIHVAMAAVNGMDYLLTWNCRHLANAAIRDKIEDACREAGMPPPIICTPEELMET